MWEFRTFDQTGGMSLHAVLTADIVNSTQLNGENEKKLMQSLHKILQPYHYEFYRGDSFQVYLAESPKALELALMCRTAAIALDPEAAPAESDIRIAIGIGTTTGHIKDLATAKGEAFITSGRAFDTLEKTAGRLVIAAEQASPIAKLALAIVGDYINTIYRQMTAKQAEVIFELLKGETQQQVAERLSRSKSTISQHVTAGKWDEIETLIKHYKTIIQEIQ